jgi:hypothetical protein
MKVERRLLKGNSGGEGREKQEKGWEGKYDQSIFVCEYALMKPIILYN